MLESTPIPPVRQKLYMDLLEGTQFLPRLLQSGRFDRTRLFEACRGVKGIDDLVDVRLVQLGPRRQSSAISRIILMSAWRRRRLC